MSFGYRDFGSKPGSGGVASGSATRVDRRERLRQLALEQNDLSKDPYIMRNHLGSYECKLCLTLHNTEGNYLAHTQGKRHQQNLSKRAAREQRDANLTPVTSMSTKSAPIKKKKPRIGLPGYKIVRQRDPETNQLSLRFEIVFPDIEEGFQPRHRMMSAFEQKVEPPDGKYQYLLVAAEPYETTAFKIPNKKIERSIDLDYDKRFTSSWNKDTKLFVIQFWFKKEESQKEPESIEASSNPLAPPSSNPYSNPTPTNW